MSCSWAARDKTFFPLPCNCCFSCQVPDDGYPAPRAPTGIPMATRLMDVALVALVDRWLMDARLVDIHSLVVMFFSLGMAGCLICRHILKWHFLSTTIYCHTLIYQEGSQKKLGQLTRLKFEGAGRVVWSLLGFLWTCCIKLPFSQGVSVHSEFPSAQKMGGWNERGTKMHWMDAGVW